MRVFTFLFALATPIVAFHVPTDLPDGEYDVVRRTSDSPLEFWQRKSPSRPASFVKRAKKKGKWKPDAEKVYNDHKFHEDLKPKGYSIGGSGELTVIVNDTGPSPRIERINLDSKPNSVLPFAFDRRGCFKAIPQTFPDDEYQQAKRSFINYCATHKWAYFYASISVSANVVVYTCRRENSWGTCSEGEYEFAEAIIDASCGKNAPGYAYSKKFDQEYGRAWRGVPVCHADEKGGKLAVFNNRVNYEPGIRKVEGQFRDKNRGKVNEAKMKVRPDDTVLTVGKHLDNIWDKKQKKRKAKRGLVHMMMLA